MKEGKSKKKISIVNVVFISIFCAVLVMYALGLISMLLWGLLTSLKSNLDFQFMDNILGWPDKLASHDELRLKNYKLNIEYFEFTITKAYISRGRQVIHQSTSGFFDMLLNTIVYAAIGSVVHTFVTAIVAYLCVKYKQFLLARIMYAANLVSMTLPIIGAGPAMLELLRDLGVYDSFIGMTMMKASFNGMYFLVMYAFFEGMSDSYAEAAEIDGASYYRILFSIMLPLAMKVASTTMLLNFVTYWNDYQTALLYMPTYPTLAYGIWKLSQSSIAQLSYVPARIAGSMMLALPILVLFMCAKNKMMGNISIGGVKE